MKIHKSMDFTHVMDRIEKTNSGPYLVHLEDYESLNDLIRRSVRTKTRADLPTKETGSFDDVFEVLDDTEENKQNDLLADPEVDERQQASDAERSEGKEAASLEETDEQLTQ